MFNKFFVNVYITFSITHPVVMNFESFKLLIVFLIILMFFYLPSNFSGSTNEHKRFTLS